MDIEQMKKIVDNAPDGATHCTDETPSMNLYAKVEHLGGFYVSLSNRWESYPIYAGIHLLSDFRTIIAQHEEIERLRDELSTAIEIIEDSGLDYDEVVEAKGESE